MNHEYSKDSKERIDIQIPNAYFFYEELHQIENIVRDSSPIRLIQINIQFQNNSQQIQNFNLQKPQIKSRNIQDVQDCYFFSESSDNIEFSRQSANFMTIKQQIKILSQENFSSVFSEELNKKIININNSKNNQTKKLYEYKIQEKNKKKPSKFNNMGGFLIASFSEILNKGGFKIQNNQYFIQLQSQWTSIRRIPQNLQSTYRSMTLTLNQLKKQVLELPRKEGAKKHLLRIINDSNMDSEQMKLCKCLIRKELIYNLNQSDWLLKHIESRDFKPENDDKKCSKKRSRHEDYLKYMIGIRKGLEQQDRLPKRLKL